MAASSTALRFPHPKASRLPCLQRIQIGSVWVATSTAATAAAAVLRRDERATTASTFLRHCEAQHAEPRSKGNGAFRPPPARVAINLITDP